MSDYLSILEANGMKVASTILIATGITALLKWCIQRLRFVKAIEKLPGPSLEKPNSALTPHPWLGHLGMAIDLSGGKNSVPGHPGMAKSFDILLNLHKQFSQKEGLMRIWVFNPFRLLLKAKAVIFVTDPELVQQILVDKKISKSITKHERTYRTSKALVGESFLAELSDTPKWKHQRKLTALGMHQKFLEHANSIMTKLLYETVFPQWDREAKIGNNNNNNNTTVTKEAREWCTRLVADVLGLVAFSRSFGGLEVDATSKDLHNNEQSLFDVYGRLQVLVTKRKARPLLLNLLHWQETKEFSQCQEKLNSIIQGIVHGRMEKRGKKNKKAKGEAVEESYNDLLSYLMVEDDEDPKYNLSERELMGNVRSFLFAGQDTTSSVLSDALYELAKNQPAQQRLQEEVDSLFAKCKASNQQPTYKDIMKLKYLDAVCKEALRLHAPVAVARQNIADVTLTKGDRKFFVPQGAEIYLFPSLTGLGDGQNDERMDEFLPERFLDKGKPGSFYMPFSVGPRNCVGWPLGTAKIKIALAHLIHRYTVRKTHGSGEPVKMILVTVVATQTMLDFERR